PPLVVIILVAKRVPAIPGIFVGVILGMIFAPIFQGANFGDILSSSYSGYVSQTGILALDELLTAGGLEGMMYSISLTIIAMMFGGIMEKTGQLEVIVNALLKRIKSVGGLISLTAGTCIVSNITMPEQYISLVVPGRMYARAYKDKALHPKTLSNVLESAGTLTSPLVPWNTCGAFMYNVLGVSALSYGKWAVMNYLTPIFLILLAFMGSKLVIAKIEDDPDTVIEATN
ncbi:MAG: Na+/H+ antiporter NhaC, partial [Tissierellia bacterium]|nr:Na+/H+ antiporter NhaC [Tissierellia bacterium]